MTPRRRRLRGLGVAAAVAAGTLAIAACGSGNGTSASSNGGGSSSSSATPSTVSGLKQTGPGLTEPTQPTGAKLTGGTVTFSEAPDSAPNYIFPMYSPQFCSTSNISDVMDMIYRPLYWYGNNYSPTVDYNYSIGQKPVFTNDDKTITIHLNNYKWSDGETVSSRDLVFWMNMLKAQPTNWCGYVPSRFPDNVVSYKAVNATTFQLVMNKTYNQNWLIQNELSQITPMPMAWDRTSLSAKAPSPSAANLPDTTPSGAKSVYAFLNTQGQKITQWGTSPLWSITDGPWKVSTSTANGEITFVPNTAYTGPDKPQISKFEEIPFTTDTAQFDEVKAGGPNALTISDIPAQDEPQTSSVASEGYTVNKASYYGINYFPFNLHNPTVGPVFSQLYFRQAFQHLVDQNGWITSILHGTAVNTYGPIPLAPPSSLLAGTTNTTNPYPFSEAAASKLLTANGWKVVPNGSSTCAKPGTAAGDCGKGITKGEKISFNIDYASGIEALQSEMLDLQSDAKAVGIKINLTEHPFGNVIGSAVNCKSTAPDCKWTAENWGAGWIYAPDYYPSGEDLFATGAEANYGNYDDPKMDSLINQTIVGSDTVKGMKAFYDYAATNLPVVWEPTSIGTFGASAGTIISSKLGGYTANAYGNLVPEQWYLTK